MSTLTGEQESQLLESEEELYTYFQPFAKPALKQRIGIECEFFGVRRQTGEALPYSGPQGIEAILSRLAAEFHYESLFEGGHVIALSRDETWITLEPGAQVELSAPPVRSVVEIDRQLQTFKKELEKMGKYFPHVAWLSVGIHPFSSTDEISWVPKQRYRLMAKYLPQKGALAHEMMKRTATNQVNFDFTDETNAFDQFRMVLGISSVVSALFSHSAISDGKPNGFFTRRAYVWQKTDPDRCGLLVDFIREGKNFRDYVEYLLEMPMIFIVRGETWIPMGGISFRKFIKEGKQGYRATRGDFEVHLSTAFPEARFKHYLEIRNVDAQRFSLIPSVVSFWKGIVYDEEIRKKVWNLVRDFTPSERLKLYRDVPKKGLKARLGKTPVSELARELLKLSRQGLSRQEALSGPGEGLYLERIQEEILKPQRTPAETLLERWRQLKRPKIEGLISYLEI